MRSVFHSRKLPGKLSKSLALCALLTTGHLHAQTVEDELGKDRIVTQELDPSKPIIVRTMPTVTTTVQFPGPVSNRLAARIKVCFGAPVGEQWFDEHKRYHGWKGLRHAAPS